MKYKDLWSGLIYNVAGEDEHEITLECEGVYVSFPKWYMKRHFEKVEE